jgi:hypothetical protein
MSKSKPINKQTTKWSAIRTTHFFELFKRHKGEVVTQELMLQIQADMALPTKLHKDWSPTMILPIRFVHMTGMTRKPSTAFSEIIGQVIGEGGDLPRLTKRSQPPLEDSTQPPEMDPVDLQNLLDAMPGTLSFEQADIPDGGPAPATFDLVPQPHPLAEIAHEIVYDEPARDPGISETDKLLIFLAMCQEAYRQQYGTGLSSEDIFHAMCSYRMRNVRYAMDDQREAPPIVPETPRPRFKVTLLGFHAADVREVKRQLDLEFPNRSKFFLEVDPIPFGLTRKMPPSDCGNLVIVGRGVPELKDTERWCKDKRIPFHRPVNSMASTVVEFVGRELLRVHGVRATSACR